jgi:protein-L-isoaspartate(D-aspartate) O-methyltransferase
MATLDLVAARRHYAERLRAAAGLRSDALIRAFATVPRERFLGPGPWLIVTPQGSAAAYRATPDADPTHLYHDVLVAIDAERMLNNGQPSALAMWIDALDLRAGEQVVHVGCGTGYYTAILAEVVGPRGTVVAVEVDQHLAERARVNLADRGQVHVREGDSHSLGADTADAILVNCGATHPHQAWIDALRPNGRLLVPITTSENASGIGGGAMFLVTRELGAYDARRVSSVGIYPCAGARDPALNERLARKDAADWASVRSLRRDPHEPDHTCWLHVPGRCLSRARL